VRTKDITQYLYPCGAASKDSSSMLILEPDSLLSFTTAELIGSEWDLKQGGFALTKAPLQMNLKKFE